jgi:hypothetical protein
VEQSARLKADSIGQDEISGHSRLNSEPKRWPLSCFNDIPCSGVSTAHFSGQKTPLLLRIYAVSDVVCLRLSPFQGEHLCSQVCLQPVAVLLLKGGKRPFLYIYVSM